MDVEKIGIALIFLIIGFYIGIAATNFRWNQRIDHLNNVQTNQLISIKIVN